MTKLTKRIEIRAPPETVFATISNPEKWPRWAAFVKEASSHGSKAHWVYDMGGMKVESDTEIVKNEPNRVYAFRQTEGFMKRAETRLEVRPSPGGSLVTWDIEYELPYSYLGKLADKLKARKQFDAALEDAAKGLRSHLER